MSYIEKLTKLIGRPPITSGLEAHLKYHPHLKTKEDAAKDIFRITISLPKEKAKAKKLGLI